MKQNASDPGWSTSELASLRLGLVECFNMSELASLCMDLGVEYEEIDGDGKEAKARELISFLERRQRLQDLIDYCLHMRPNYPWPSPGDVQKPQPLIDAVSGTAVWQLRKQREAADIQSLRAERMTPYTQLWALLEPLAKYGRSEPFTYVVAQRLSESLRKWYFHEGGIYLSENSRKPYFALQDALQDIVINQDRCNATQLIEEKFEPVRRRGSDLRAALAEDLGTRT